MCLRPYTIERAADDGERAAELYKGFCDGREFDEDLVNAVAGGNLNNLAYFFCFDRSDPSFDVVKGREYLRRLKLLVGKDTWGLKYPEYFHTEAHVEYEEFLRDLQAGVPKEALRAKLLQAQGEIRKACSLYPEKQLYKELANTIDNALSRI